MKNNCKTYFSISGDFDPQQITKMLNVEPTRCHGKDDLRRDGKPYNFALWAGCLCDEYDVYVENQMEKTIEPLLDKIDVLKQIKEQFDVEMFLSVVPHAVADQPTPCLAPSLKVMQFCVEVGVKIDIDLYIYNGEEE